jgi:hypothetical protein
MDDAELDEVERAAAGRIADALAAEAAVIGPMRIDEDGDAVPGEPVASAELREWVVMMSWRDHENDVDVVTRFTSADLPRTHENGLLFEGLHHFE